MSFGRHLITTYFLLVGLVSVKACYFVCFGEKYLPLDIFDTISCQESKVKKNKKSSDVNLDFQFSMYAFIKLAIIILCLKFKIYKIIDLPEIYLDIPMICIFSRFYQFLTFVILNLTI